MHLPEQAAKTIHPSLASAGQFCNIAALLTEQFT